MDQSIRLSLLAPRLIWADRLIFQDKTPLSPRLSPLAPRLSPLALRLSPLAPRLSPLAWVEKVISWLNLFHCQIAEFSNPQILKSSNPQIPKSSNQFPPYSLWRNICYCHTVGSWQSIGEVVAEHRGGRGRASGRSWQSIGEAVAEHRGNRSGNIGREKFFAHIPSLLYGLL